jgi:NAD(P)-dependent dehydrogenase (short-subunit alcohol dehydrogenase family)/CMP-N-acetylneuraminic acid synthetase
MCIIIIPIKQESERVPGKNYRDFNGQPLYFHIIETALRVGELELLVIDTNSWLIRKGISAKFQDPRIRIYERPSHLCPGDTPVNGLLKNVICALDLRADLFVQTHVTNPLLSAETIDDAIGIFHEKRKEGYDSLFSTRNYQTRLYRQSDALEAVNHNMHELTRTQDLETYYEENSCLYLFTKEGLWSMDHRIGSRPYLYLMSDLESSDIDTETDFLVAQFLHARVRARQRVVLITGVLGGIGMEMARKFKGEGWRVVGTDTTETQSLPCMDRYVSADLTDPVAMQGIVEDLRRHEDRLDCFVHCAALQMCGPVWDLPEGDWDMMQECNLKTVYRLVKHGVDLLRASGGNLISIASVHGTHTAANIAGYATSKAALIGLTRNLAIELGTFGVRANSISPGAVDTAMLRAGLARGHAGEGSSDAQVASLGARHLLGRVGTAAEIAEIAFAVCQNKFLNGANIVADGGVTVHLRTE